MNLFKFIFYVFITALVYFVFRSNFSFALSYVLIYFLEIFLFLPLRTVNEIGHERINFNIKTSSIRSFNYNRLIKIKIIFVITILIMTLLIELKPYFNIQFFLPTQAFLTVEHAAYEDLAPSVYKLSLNNQNINVDSSSFIKINLTNTQKSNDWKLFVQGNEFTTHQFTANSLPSLVNLRLTNGHKTFTATLNIIPIPLPIVTLKQEPVKYKFNDNSMHKLAFSVNVTSKINLTNLILSIRTESGFKFEQNLAEFANNNQKDFHLPYTELVTTGIPFKENDILYVKSIARTPVLNQSGESAELQFKVQSPTKIKKDIIKELNAALSLLKKSPNDNKVQEHLFKAIELASIINPNGFIVQKITEIISSVENKQYKISEKKIVDLINALQWQIEQKNAQDLIYKIQLLKQNLTSAKSRELETTTKEVIEQLKSSAKKLNYTLTKEEKKQLIDYFHNDTTAKNLFETANNLDKNKLDAAKFEVTEAYDSAKTNIAGIMRILKLGRKKSLDKKSQEEEERGEKEDQQEEDMRNYRSYMDTVASQGLLDQSFRKNILDNITRLKKEGNPANSQMIDYLESQLR